MSDEIGTGWTVAEKDAVQTELAVQRQQIIKLEQLKNVNIMSEVDAPALTENSEVNNQLIKYFWMLILLSFFSQLIGYLIQWISGTIDVVVLLILSLGAVNTLLIGGAVKLVQKQMSTITDKYNTTSTSNNTLKKQLTAANEANAKLQKQLNDRDAEIISLKVNQDPNLQS